MIIYLHFQTDLLTIFANDEYCKSVNLVVKVFGFPVESSITNQHCSNEIRILPVCIKSCTDLNKLYLIHTS